MRGKGRLSTWDDAKGFGFIEPFDGGKRLFIHISAFSRRGRRPEIGNVVTYTIATDDKGRSRAEKATLAGLPSLRKHRRGRDGRGRGGRAGESRVRFATGVAGLFFLALTVLVLTTGTSAVLLLYYAIASAVTLVAYAFDKFAAQQGDGRTPEKTLHLLSLLGGWPGGLIGRHRFRHKTLKQPFRTVFWLTVVGNIAALMWLMSSDDASELRQLLAL